MTCSGTTIVKALMSVAGIAILMGAGYFGRYTYIQYSQHEQICIKDVEIIGHVAIFATAYYIAGIFGCVPLPECYRVCSLPKPFKLWKVWRLHRLNEETDESFDRNSSPTSRNNSQIQRSDTTSATQTDDDLLYTHAMHENIGLQRPLGYMDIPSSDMAPLLDNQHCLNPGTASGCSFEVIKESVEKTMGSATSSRPVRMSRKTYSETGVSQQGTVWTRRPGSTSEFSRLFAQAERESAQRLTSSCGGQPTSEEVHEIERYEDEEKPPSHFTVSPDDNWLRQKIATAKDSQVNLNSLD